MQVLGHGAFGSVYLGKHFLLEHKPPVAIKVLNTTLNTQEESDRFFQEAVLLDELTHPNILPIIDANLYEDFPFFVTEYAPGGSLRDVLDQLDGAPMPLEDAVHLLSQVGAGLQHAHDLDIVHRDLKPANILFNAHGDALLADFGIALQLQKTRRVDEIGTPPYMAPEQFKGQVSKKSDQYALGCVTYELLTGQPLFIAEDPYTMGYKHIYEQPISLCDLNPHIPPAIEDVVFKALAKNRDERYASVADFVTALQNAAGMVIRAAAVEQDEGQHVPEQHKSSAIDTYPLGANVDPHNVVPHIKRATRFSDARHPQPDLSSASAPNHQAEVIDSNSPLISAWSITAGADHTYYSEPTAVNGVVYAGTYTTSDKSTGEYHQMRALDALTGTQLWAFPADYSIYDAPIVAGNVVYFSSGDINRHGKVYALDAITGQMRWSFGTEEYLKAMPTLVDNVIYAHSQHGVTALDAATGQKLWGVALKAALSNRPMITNGVVYLGTEVGNCYALDAKIGKKLVTFTDVGEVQAAVTTLDGVICICFYEGELYALDMTTGALRWSIQIDKHVSGGLVVSNGIAYVGSHGGFVGDSAHTKLSALDISAGKLLWVVHIRHEVESSPVVADGVVYVSTFGRELYAVDIQQGGLLFSTRVGRGRINRPSVENGMIFVSTGEMHAFFLPRAV
ncbi:MAG: hypothetical protein NVS2B12_04270 [Ktedonobacteraceae bacterium]